MSRNQNKPNLIYSDGKQMHFQQEIIQHKFPGKNVYWKHGLIFSSCIMKWKGVYLSFFNLIVTSVHMFNIVFFV